MVAQTNQPTIYPKIQFHLVSKRIEELKQRATAARTVQDRQSFHHPFAEQNGFDLKEVSQGYARALCKPPFDKTRNAYGNICGATTAAYADVASADCAEAFIEDVNSGMHAVTSELSLKYHQPVKEGDSLSVETIADTEGDSDSTLTVYGIIKNQQQAKVATSIAKMSFVDAQGRPHPKSQVIKNLAV